MGDNDYKIVVRITDRQLKPGEVQEVQDIQLEDRVTWTETIEANGFQDEEQAKLAVLLQLHNSWSAKKYEIKVESCEVKMIREIKKPDIILPDEHGK
jgi:hypothetical protein